jgi:hypothetical protein
MSRRAILTVLITTALVALPANALAAKAPTPAKQAKQAFAQLIKDTRKTQKRFVSKRNKAKLLRTARKARKQSGKRPCKAIKTLRAYRRQLRRVKKRRNVARQVMAGSPRGLLQARLVTLTVALKQSPRAKRCGGGKRNRVDEAKATVLESNERTLKVRVQMPPANFIPHQVGGQDFLELEMEGTGTGADKGDPGLPALSSFYAIPEGATVDIDASNAKSYTIPGVNLYPEQVQPVDQAPPTPKPPIEEFLEPPFRIDKKAYDSNRQFPRSPVDGGGLGAMRDVIVGGLSVAGGQYRPRSNTLKVFTSIDVTVNFRGDNKGTFGDRSILNQWNIAFANDYDALLNFETLLEKLRPIPPVRFCGEELLIITSAELRPAADTLRAQRQAQGYITSVREVGSGAGQIGTTNLQIRDFIRNRLTGPDCLIHPSYVILFGNTAHVPTFLAPCSPGGNPVDCNIASDLDYSLNGIGTDLFADVQLGRLPAPSLDAANALVAKLQTYSTTNPAPPGDDFLDHAAVTSYFQPPLICVLNEGATGAPNCNADAPPVTGHWEINYPANTDTRGFTITAERIRNAIAADGYEVDRLYTTDDEDVIPLNYWNGTPIPSHLRRPAFAWDANTTDFFNTYNDGRFVILHRDHGWPDGFAEPTLHSGHVPFFTNGAQQPVVFGINCASAAFDTPAHPSFVELQVLRPDGGAIAGFGDTRVSPSFPNNHMALGFFDAMFPSTVAGYGGPETRRLGDILVRGKQYMATQEGFEWHGAGDTYVEHYLYHLLGDPTMQMWANPPTRFNLGGIRTVWRQVQFEPGEPRFQIEIRFPPIGGGDPPPFNTVATLLHDGEPIGRALVGQDGTATIRPEVRTDNQNLTVVYSQEGAIPAQDAVENAPGKTATSLTLAANGSPAQTGGGDFEGAISPALGGKQIRLVYERTTAPGSTTTQTVSTAANGTYTDHFDFSGQYPSHWRVQAFFDGDEDTAPSSSPPIEFDIGD